jgi:uncharacterized protein
MSDLENANPSVPASRPPARTWDFMETVFVSLIAYGVYTVAGELLFSILAIPDAAKMLSPHFGARGFTYILASPPAIGVLWIAIRMARRDFVEYLGLNWPTMRQLLRAMAITAIVLLAEILAGYAIGAQEISPYLYLGANEAGGLFIFLIGGCIAAPVVEEFVIRGFMFRGWSQSFLGPVGCIVLTSALWGMMHTHYHWFGRLCIFVTGLALGYFRWRDNSTWLTVMVHSAMNIFVFFAAAL